MEEKRTDFNKLVSFLFFMDYKIKQQLIKIVGNTNISFNIEERLCYSKDITPISYKWMHTYKTPPYLSDCVIHPETSDQIKKNCNIMQ